MVRAVIFFLLIALLAAAVVWLAERPGDLLLTWQGYRIEMPLVLAVALMAAAVIVVVLVWRGISWLIHGPAQFSAARAHRRLVDGQLALSQGMVAVAAGDRQASLRFARKAETMLGEGPLTMLLSAQAAQLSGDETAAHRYFAAMLERPEMEFLGLRGLLTEAERDGRPDEALNLARRAFLLNPDAPWLLSTLFGLEARAGNWREAERVTERALKNKLLPESESRRRLAIARFEQAEDAKLAGDLNAALKLAESAHALDPGFGPAALLAAEILHVQGNRRRAARVVEDTWGRLPHPDLAAQYRLVFAGEDAGAIRRRVERLAALAPDDPESRLALAAAAVDSRDFGLARLQLQPLLAGRPDARTLRAMAELEEAEHGAVAAEAWVARIGRAPDGPAWVCQVCGRQHPAWQPHCDGCESFDSLRWTSPAGDLLALDGIAATPPVGDAVGGAERPGALISPVLPPSGAGSGPR